MRIVVTGGPGFVGSHFVRQALTGAYAAPADAEIVVVDKLTYAGNEANSAEVAASPRLLFVHGDICDAALVNDLLRGADQVVHFAAESHVDRSISGAEDFITTNVIGTHTLLEAAVEAEVAKFVHVSTGEVYGSIGVGSWTEKEPLDPSSPYSASKASSELLARAFHRTHGLPVCVTRCANNCGPYQHPEKVVPLFITHLMDGEPVPLYGDGANVRDRLHLEDHCRAVALGSGKGRGRGGVQHRRGYGTGQPGAHGKTPRIPRCRLVDGAGSAGRKGARPSLFAGRHQDFRRTWLPVAVPFEEGLADTVKWYAKRRDWWEPLKRGG